MLRNLEFENELKDRMPESVVSASAVAVDEMRQIEGGTAAGYYQPFTGLEWYSPYDYDRSDPQISHWPQSETAVRNGFLLKT